MTVDILLVGKLQHASKVVQPGRTFLHRMFAILKGSGRHQPLIRLNAAFRSDPTWWHTFLEHWNGVAMFAAAQGGPPDHHLFTDASGTLGCGAWSGYLCFQYLWPEAFARTVYRGEGATPNCAGLHRVGHRLETTVGASPLRQPIRGGRSELGLQQGRPADAPAQEPLLCHSTPTDCTEGSTHTGCSQYWGGCHSLG